MRYLFSVVWIGITLLLLLACGEKGRRGGRKKGERERDRGYVMGAGRKKGREQKGMEHNGYYLGHEGNRII
jgi:hypothetical protein